MRNSARIEILNRIRREGLGESRDGLEQKTIVGVDRVEMGKKVQAIMEACQTKRADLITQFKNELEKVKGKVYLAPSRDALSSCLENIANRHGVRLAVRGKDQSLERIGIDAILGGLGIRVVVGYIEPGGDKSCDKFLEEAKEADIGITTVDYALADTGTIVLLTRVGHPRSISLLAPIHLAVVKPEQIIRGLEDLFDLIKYNGQIGSCMTFITGPSRTADIEQVLAIGVHGPRELHCVVLNEASN